MKNTKLMARIRTATFGEAFLGVGRSGVVAVVLTRDGHQLHMTPVLPVGSDLTESIADATRWARDNGYRPSVEA